MKKASSKVIPEEMLNLILEKLDSLKSGYQAKTGQWSFIPHLRHALRQFLDLHKKSHPQLSILFPQGPSEDLLRRAFNQKSPPGATRPLRDLLFLFASDNARDWNATIQHQFMPRLQPLLDSLKEDVPLPADFKVKNLADQLASVLAQKLSERELDLLRRQIEQESSGESMAIENIIVPSVNDPACPEFPPKPFFEPTFPATRTYRIEVPGFTNVWLKDESTNPTGTHKARMAWEVVIKAKQYNIKEMSLISSGSAAVAIQFFFNLYQVPTVLKVLVDHHMPQATQEALRDLGCEVYTTDLSARSLSGQEIKELTKNKKGIDITYREVLDRFNDNYYDWLSYEVLNENPRWCFVPFGTGDLFVNILIIAEREFNNRIYRHDPRFLGDSATLGRCHFMGATSRDPGSPLDKLFSYYLPSLADYEDYFQSLIMNMRIGNHSGIFNVEEKYLRQAMELAAAQNITCEPSGIAGLGLLLQQAELVPRDEKVLIINTGKTNLHPVLPLTAKA